MAVNTTSYPRELPKCVLILLVAIGLWSTGCRSPKDYRENADETAYDIIEQKQKAVGQEEPFSIERPMDTFRRRLMAQQNLAHASEASLGVDQLKPIEHWPADDYLESRPVDANDILSIDPNRPTVLSLVQALEIGARNSFEYQTQKEGVFRVALDLDLERHDFRTQFFSQMAYLASTDGLGSDSTSGGVGSADGTASHKFKNGMDISGTLAVDLANLWSGGSGSSLGLIADASISIPLLRGSGRHIVTEALTQAERNVIYTIWEFERFKRTFAVNVYRLYLSVLQQQDTVKNASQNYISLVRSARWTRRRADAGRLPEIQVDQALQNELSARNNWISAQQTYESRLDAFKGALGLPPDAAIDLDANELETLRSRAQTLLGEDVTARKSTYDVNDFPVAEAEVDLVPPTQDDAGPLELPEDQAVQLALENRLDLKVALGEVQDAQRKVVVLADALRAELTLLGRADMGSGRSVSSADQPNATLDPRNGSYSALLTLDLPFERTTERNAYRNGLINLERAVRDLQSLEDQIKLAIRTELRDLLDSRESLKIQALSVLLADKRVASASMFVQAGRSEIRDLLDAQDDLLSAQNSRTNALVSYRITELELQRDMGVLEVNDRGLMSEYIPPDKSPEVEQVSRRTEDPEHDPVELAFQTDE
ncbi:TolC family protein [Planctomycetota bacterium]